MLYQQNLFEVCKRLDEAVTKPPMGRKQRRRYPTAMKSAIAQAPSTTRTVNQGTSSSQVHSIFLSSATKETVAQTVEQRSTYPSAPLQESTLQPQISPELLDLENRLLIRLLLCLFLMLAAGYSLYQCFSLIASYLAQGHQITQGFLERLCGATIVQVSVMLGVFVRAVWPRAKRS